MAKPLIHISYDKIKLLISSLGIDRPEERVFGVPKGGLCCAALLKHADVVTDPLHATVILDDIEDSGRTRTHYMKTYPHARWVSLFNSKSLDYHGAWIVFPWEQQKQDATGPADAVVRLLQFMGEDPSREGLKDTPTRVLRALKEMTLGYARKPEEFLKSVFVSSADQMIILKGTSFTSMCEHHLLPFTGTANVAYIPNGKVIGISKICRIVDMYASRLQIQEQLTQQIAKALMDSEFLNPKGVGVIINAHHGCMSCRGVRQSGTSLVTSCLLGVIREDKNARSEFLKLVIEHPRD